MTKRNAATNLTQDNWDDDEEPEEQGQFVQATDEELQKRVIKVAKRRTLNAGFSSGAFAAFAGFAAAKNNSVFESKSDNASNNNNLFGNSTTKSVTLVPVNGLTTTSLAAGSDKPSQGMASSNASVPSRKDGSRPAEYFQNLKALNKSVKDWINLHVDKSPCCVLTPVFKDYMKYLDELNEKYPAIKDDVAESKTDTQTSAAPKECSAPASITAPANSAVPKTDSVLATDKPVVENFLFRKDESPKVSAVETSVSKAGFLFGSSSTSLRSNSVFSFAATAPDHNKEADDEPYEPPEPEVVPVIEDDAFYSIKCKLFYKHQDKYNERGLGMLHLKKVDGKTQLVIRADTHLGNILLNVIVNEDTKMQLNGKHVILACIPNPPISDVPEGPVTMLIRVKSEEDAQKLLDMIDEHKLGE